MDFKTAAKLGRYISKEYAQAFFTLLVNYRDISASEAASRLNLHINTAQEFLEALASLDIVAKREVSERKRPYFRYALKRDKISMEVDLATVKKGEWSGGQDRPIRERKNASVRFVTARNGQSISAVTIWAGRGRQRQERRINLTAAQGLFLYHLPFPDGRPLTVRQIMDKAGVDDSSATEILDIVEFLTEYNVIEFKD